jgi:diguanylate cyclase (GGDEF)-like protein
MWLTGWLMILLHFLCSLFRFAPGIWGTLVMTILLSSLVWAGILFISASLPYSQERSSHWMRVTLIGVNTLYIGLLLMDQTPLWALNTAAAMLGLGPLGVVFFSRLGFFHMLRRFTVLLNMLLSIFVLVMQNRSGGSYIALNAVLFTVYLGCGIHFWYAYRRATAGALVTIAGFFAWASVFVAAPLMTLYLPKVTIESGVWNLPKYVVAVGMILLLLEDQIEHNKFLALHDELTGLANRRLFQDRLTTALERSRRNGSQTALLLLDLDRFKEVNDTLGHHTGDQLLHEVGKALLRRVRRTDTVARTGGDEFSLILEPSNRADAEGVGTSLLQLLELPMEVGGHTVQVGASLGIAIFPEDAADEEELRIAADLRMYRHKNHRRGLRQREPAFPTVDEEDAEELRIQY